MNFYTHTSRIYTLIYSDATTGIEYCMFALLDIYFGPKLLESELFTPDVISAKQKSILDLLNIFLAKQSSIMKFVYVLIDS